MLKLAPVAFLLACAACAADSTSTAPTAREYYDRSAMPVLSISCTGNTTGCHSRSEGPTAYFVDNDEAGYQTAIIFAGHFDANATLLVAHPTIATLSPAAEDVILHWFALERAERGL